MNEKNDKLVKQIPNIFTLLRVIFVVISFVLIINKMFAIAAILLVMGAISDFLDGYFARALNVQSSFGAKLDQIADKLFEILICFGLIFVSIKTNWFLIITLALELIFSVVVIIDYFKTKKWKVSTNIGKFKTLLMFVTIIFSLLSLMYNDLYVTFLVFWGLTTIVQLYGNYVIVNKYNKINESIDNEKVDNKDEVVNLDENSETPEAVIIKEKTKKKKSKK